MSNKITTPFPLFSDIDGSPLNAGFLFLGESEKDAEQFPIVAYWDETKTQIVQQPVSTRNGFIVRNNLPAKIFIEEESCSITIKDQNNYVIQSVLSYDQLSTVRGVKALIQSEQTRAEIAEQSLDLKITAEKDRAIAIEQSLQLQITTGNSGIKYFSTEAEVLTFTPGADDPKQAYAFDTKKNYLWNGTAWIDEGVSLLDLAAEKVVEFYTPDLIKINIDSVKWAGAAIETTTGNPNIFSFASDRYFLQIDVSEAKKIKVENARTDVSSWKWVFRDKNLNLLGYSPVGNFEIDIPSGSKWAMRTHTVAGFVENVNLSVSLLSNNTTQLANLASSIDAKSYFYSDEPVPVNYQIQQGVRAVSTNSAQPLEIFSANTADVRAYIQLDVENFSVLKIAGARTDVSAWVWVFRDKNLRLVSISTFYGNGDLSVPEGAKYAYRTTRVDSLSLIENIGMTINAVYKKSSLQAQINSLVASVGQVTISFPWIYGAAVSTNVSTPSVVLAPREGRAYIKIDVELFDKIKIDNAITTVPGWTWVFRDGNDGLIQFSSFYGNGVLTVPDGAKWAYRTVRVDSLSLIENTEMSIIGILGGTSVQNQIDDQRLELQALKVNVDRLLFESLSKGKFVSPNHFEGNTQHDRIDAALAFIKKRGWGILELGLDTISIPNTNQWLRSSAILIPDNCWIYLNNGKVKLQDGVFDNIFRNEGIIPSVNPYSPATELRENSNIRIFGTGIGSAFIEGPDVPYTAPHPINGGDPVPWVGDWYGWRTIGILLANVKNYKIHDFKMSKTTCWAISQEHGCEDFEVFNLDFDTNVKNGDGIDVRQGCKNGVIYNISGHTYDDTVALSAIQNFITQHPSGSYIYPVQVGGYSDRGFGGNIENVRIYDIGGNGNHNGVRLLTSGGSKLHDVSVDDVRDENGGYSGSVVYVSSGYGSQATMGDFKNIYVNGVKSSSSNTALFLQGPLQDSQFNYIRQLNQSGVLVNQSGATFENTTVTNAAME